MSNVIVRNTAKFTKTLMNNLEKQRNLTNWESFSLLYEYRKETAILHEQQLKAIRYLKHVTFLKHQIEVAEKVIYNMNGRAILADEVGLGKTIEAGLILKEYLFRNAIKRVLILVPSSLVNQWQQELYEKFYIKDVTFLKHNR